MSNNLKISEIINSDSAVSTSDGNIVYNKIEEFLKEASLVYLDFEGIKYLTTAFLNAALGQLYSQNYTSDFLNQHLKIRNVTKANASMFHVVVKRAKEYFDDKEGFKGSAESAIYGD